MALVISFQNVTNLEPLSDYKVDVWINERHIAGPFLLKHHKREDGWQELVKQFAKDLPSEKYEPPKRGYHIL